VVQRFIQTLLHRADIGQSRTSALNPLQWFMVIIGFILLAVILGKAPVWIMVIVAIAMISASVFFLYCFLYLMKNDPDSLRSETYLVSKLAIQKGMMGDNLIGLIQDSTSPTLLPEKMISVEKNEKSS
jgi:uncharacterized MAPEG superfamily protein